ncbi:MAG TPA: hypothetical protein VMR75_03720, partial [Candidatus Saccharimonadales bacterium]|nr:hypothetical protein [Candidatus Saccharimonadales bacterium]
LATYGPFAATEVLIIEAVKQGANRQAIHELLRTIALEAWPAEQPGEAMVTLLKKSAELKQYIPAAKLEKLLNVRNHVGDAPERAKALAATIREALAA